MNETGLYTNDETPAVPLLKHVRPGRIASMVHRAIDRSGRRTYVFERMAVRARELVLLGATLFVSISTTDVRSWIPAIIGATVAYVQADDRRERSSIAARHAEYGNKAAPLPTGKQWLLDRIVWREQVFTWLWPLLSALLAAGYARSITGSLIIALVSGYARAVWESKWWPTWRKSRLAWRHYRGQA